MNGNRLLTAPIGSTIARMAAPSTIAMTMALITSSTEAWLAGQVGVHALAGLALAFPMFMMITMVSTGAVGGVVAGSIAQALGAGSSEKANSIAFHAILLALIFGGMLAVLFIVFGTEIYSLLGGTGVALDQAIAYSNIFFAGGFIVWLLNINSSIVRACGHMKFAAFALVIGSFIQIISSVILVLGVGPVPAMGIIGAAWGILIGALIANILLLFYILGGYTEIRLQVAYKTFSLTQLIHLLKPALMASISPLSSIATVSFLTALVARHGEVALAGFGIGTRMEFLLIPLVFGIGAALITLVGLHFGAGEFRRGHKVAWTGSIAAAFITGGIGLILALFPGLWAGLFTDEVLVQEVCASYLRIVGPFYGFFGLGLALFFSSQGARRLTWPVAVSLLRLVIVAVIGSLLMTRDDVSITHIFMLTAFGLASYGILMAAVVKFGAFKSTLKASLA